MIIDSFQAQGKRSYMEDFMLEATMLRGTLLGVFDGHGGHFTAEWLHQNSELALARFLNTVGDIQEALRYTVRYLAELTNENRDGSTLSLAFIPNYTGKTEVYTAQIGDSPIIIQDKWGKVNYGSDHNVRSNPIEADKAIERGGMIHNGYLFYGWSGDGLQMARALGDDHLGKVLSREPDLRYFEMGTGSFMLMGSDGLFDPSHAGMEHQHIAVDLVLDGITAETLVNHALNVPTHDNVTAIIVRF